MYRRYTVIACCGAAFAAVLERTLFTLEQRYAVAVAAGIALLSLAMVLAHRGHDLPLYLLAFNLPFTSIEKSFFLSATATYVTPGFALGLMEILLFSLYAMWFYRIIIARQERIPKLTKIDWAVIVFLVAHVLSLYGSASRDLTILEILRLTKYAAVFFLHRAQTRTTTLENTCSCNINGNSVSGQLRNRTAAHREVARHWAD